mmetsp:Transcript_12479/g.35038  ORF Transcript_12479/g.35038 Transcript_12479/m.35038 type:complete len:202 (+) Transcript_12479:711-1316(+)
MVVDKGPMTVLSTGSARLFSGSPCARHFPGASATRPNKGPRSAASAERVRMMYFKFGRFMGPVTDAKPDRNDILFSMSARTSCVHVAVRHMTGTPLKALFSTPSSRYEGRKSWPQDEMQWASSTANKTSLPRMAASSCTCDTANSGVAYTTRYEPAATAGKDAANSPRAPEPSRAAGIRRCCRARTWSCIRATRGEITNAQ